MSFFAGLFGGGREDVGARVKEVVAAGARVVDVRTPEEYAMGHVPGAVNIPLSVLPVRLAELGPRDRPLVLYCRSGARSAQATQFLTRQGFTDILDVGPMSAFPR